MLSCPFLSLWQCKPSVAHRTPAAPFAALCSPGKAVLQSFHLTIHRYGKSLLEWGLEPTDRAEPSLFGSSLCFLSPCGLLPLCLYLPLLLVPSVGPVVWILGSFLQVLAVQKGTSYARLFPVSSSYIN